MSEYGYSAPEYCGVGFHFSEIRFLYDSHYLVTSEKSHYYSHAGTFAYDILLKSKIQNFFCYYGEMF